MLPMTKKSFLSFVLLTIILTGNVYSQSVNNKFSIQGYYGSTFPVTSLSNYLADDFSWGVELGYKLTKSTQAVIGFAVNDFSGNPDPSVEFYNDYNRAYQYTAGIKQYFPLSENFFTYGKGQAGLYNVREFDTKVFPPETSQNAFGLNAGGGVLYRYDNTLGAFAETVFHNVFTNESLSFVTVQGGIKFDF